MSRDIELIHELEEAISHKIEIRQELGKNLRFDSYFKQAREAQNGQLDPTVCVNVDYINTDTKLAIVDRNSCVKRLYLNRVSLECIPDSLFQLENLELLHLYHNELSTIPIEITSLPSLRALIIFDNKLLRELPSALLQLPSLEATFFGQVSGLSVPPQEIACQGLDAIRNYFDSLEKSSGIDYLYEAKLVLVGRGFAGKTSLVRKLINPYGYHLEDKIKSTEGIDIQNWDLAMPLEKSDKFRFNLWDFAGQEKYDATHQFFITERTLYLFVTEARQESNYLDFDYWLNIVQMLGNNSPVIVIQNKIDERLKSLPTDSFRAQFPNIVDFVDVSCADGYEQTIEKLTKTIKQAVNKLPQVGDQLPAEWVEIRQDLKALG